MSKLYDQRWWRRFSQNYLRANPLCRMCQDIGVVRAATCVDHVEAHRGDPVKFRAGPFQPLCSVCHGAIKQAEEHGRIRGCSADGTPLARQQTPKGASDLPAEQPDER